ncbi:MAG: winged helix-turn-helix transcriptional regulator [Kordiimonadaceae bacterium]|nr:winged helix-turn-helix transcriptional regulator [Kordiimonadaceae bacterium]MBO6570031.1 winged helix-turn-helix transcriptional regulator [Kordiimonadaceae bacterium]MBO6965872.1 winged helix-turn-helix transcriptional regulator [Kordiimonadaceae bacterium]
MTKNDKPSDALLLADFLPYRLSVLSNRISRSIADGYEGRFQLTLPEWRVMAVLGEEPDLSAGQVADRTAMDKVAVSRAVNKLLETGRIERHFANEDRRRSVLALSEIGNEVYSEIVPIALGYEAKLLEHFSEKERGQLEALLMKLNQSQIEVAED